MGFFCESEILVWIESKMEKEKDAIFIVIIFHLFYVCHFKSLKHSWNPLDWKNRSPNPLEWMNETKFKIQKLGRQKYCFINKAI